MRYHRGFSLYHMRMRCSLRLLSCSPALPDYQIEEEWSPYERCEYANRYFRCRDCPADGIDCSPERLLLGVAIDAGRDKRESDGLAAILPGQGKGGAVAGDQKFPFPAVPSLPAGADGMDDIFTRKSISFCDFCGSRFTAAKRPTFLQKLWPGGPVDAAIYAPASQKGGVGGIDDGVHMHFSNIIPYDLQRHRCFPFRSPGKGVCCRAGQSSPGIFSAIIVT